jgi:UrcA family protein
MTIRKLLRSSLAGIALSAAAAVLASPAASAATPAIGTLTVRYRDVDLSTTQGAATLYRRLQGAARFVCGESDNSLAQQRSWNDCYRRALADAVGTIDNPRLSALYREHSGAAAVTAMLTR